MFDNLKKKLGGSAKLVIKKVEDTDDDTSMLIDDKIGNTKNYEAICKDDPKEIIQENNTDIKKEEHVSVDKTMKDETNVSSANKEIDKETLDRENQEAEEKKLNAGEVVEETTDEAAQGQDQNCSKDADEAAIDTPEISRNNIVDDVKEVKQESDDTKVDEKIEESTPEEVETTDEAAQRQDQNCGKDDDEAAIDTPEISGNNIVDDVKEVKQESDDTKVDKKIEESTPEEVETTDEAAKRKDQNCCKDADEAAIDTPEISGNNIVDDENEVKQESDDTKVDEKIEESTPEEVEDEKMKNITKSEDIKTTIDLSEDDTDVGDILLDETGGEVNKNVSRWNRMANRIKLIFCKTINH